MTKEMFDTTAREILDGRNFAVVATVNPDGGPQSSVIWYKREGDTLVFSTTDGRRKARNLARDPRLSVTVFDLADPYRSVEIRGTAELLPDEARALPPELSRRYLGTDSTPDDPEGTRRLIVRVIPRKVVVFSA